MSAGAAGFLLKDTTPDRIIAAVHAVAAGDIIFAASITRRLIETYATHHQTGAGRGHRVDDLTPRETEVLRLVGHGLTNEQIADRLVLSQATVKTHVKRLMSKLAVSSRAQTVVVAYESNLVVPSRPQAKEGHPGTGPCRVSRSRSNGVGRPLRPGPAPGPTPQWAGRGTLDAFHGQDLRATEGVEGSAVSSR